MSLRIYICLDDNDADRIIAAERIKSADPALNPTVLTEPDIIIYDYSEDPDNPMQINENKVCVVFEE